MKLTAILLFSIILQAGATSYAQKISISVKDPPISQVFEQIQDQSGYDFLYTNATIKRAKPVNIHVINAELEDVLKLVFDQQHLTYSLENRSVVVSSGKKTMLDKLSNVMNSIFSKIDVRGRILDQDGNPLSGATVRLKGGDRTTVTNERGMFTLSDIDEGSVLVIAYVGYVTLEISAKSDLGDIKLKTADNQLQEISVSVSTGYQTLSKERATGSFTQVNKELINRSVGTNLLSRLDGVTSGLIFGKTANKASYGPSSNGGDPGISIRGRSTLFSNTEPLVVLDNFPYDGDLNNLNPNDVESVTILKDAAAASIWGVRAANGVIVITTKKGAKNQAPTVSFKTDLTITGKPDVYKVPQMTSREFIEFEKLNFENGVYDVYLNYAPFNFQTPAVDILDDEKKGIISHELAASKLAALENIDYRDDYTKYFLRKATGQQYALSISGGSASNQYYISGGYDRNLYSLVSDSYNRYNLTANNTYSLLNDRLTITARYLFSRSENRSNPGAFNPQYPYAQLVDGYGNGLPVNASFRQKYKDDLSGIGLLDWNYYPYNERKYDKNRTNLTDNQLGLQLNYKLIPEILNVDLNYQFQQGTTTENQRSDLSTYKARLAINQFSQTAASGAISYPLPMGGLMDITNNSYKSNSGRLQLNYHQVLNSRHEITALTGTEIKDYNSFYEYRKLYGYNEDTATDYPVNYFESYPQRIGYAASIVYQNNQAGTTDRFFSYFANASYSYDQRYTLSASARKDESNLFGVKANQKGIPLYSIGLSWNVNKEAFYKSGLLPYLRLRLTDGYNGNLNKNLSAYTTARNAGLSPGYYVPQQVIINPPNPSLKWERVHVMNASLDFAFRNNFISGSVDFYSKRGTDLIGASPVAPQAGVTRFTGNTASVLTKGVDVSLNSINLKGRLTWTTNLLFNYVKDKVTDFKLERGTNSDYVSQNYLSPFVGKPYSALFAFPWAGLDAEGNPKGYLDGVESKDYGTILISKDDQDIRYIGTSIPTVFGSIRNNLSFKGVEFSFNITYKLGYYFRRGSFNGTGSFSQADYSRRWMKPGDELTTNVPALSYPVNTQSWQVYTGSEALVEKGDHVRIKDIQLSYTFPKLFGNVIFNNLKLYAYADNIGIIWRKNKLGLDPIMLVAEFTFSHRHVPLQLV